VRGGYGEWSTGFWQWLAAAPLDHNPGLDETGVDIGYGQSGSVWYLCPNFSGAASVRTGVIPAGISLFIALVAFETSSQEGYGTTEEELRGAADGIVDMVEGLSAEVDGVPLTDLYSYRFQSPELFSLTVPEDNVFDLWIPGVDTPAGTYYPCVADGYYLMLAPLNAGEHTIHWTGAIPAFGYFPDITYHLTVVGRHGGDPMKQDDPNVTSTSWGAIKDLYR
jgi:hypothetical protein